MFADKVRGGWAKIFETLPHVAPITVRLTILLLYPVLLHLDMNLTLDHKAREMRLRAAEACFFVRDLGLVGSFLWLRLRFPELLDPS